MESSSDYGNNAEALSPFPDGAPGFHLGGENYVQVTDFLGTLRIHIRKFVKNEDGTFIPTKDGTTMSCLTWMDFAKDMESINVSGGKKITRTINDCLIVSKEDCSDFLAIQRYTRKSPYLRFFIPTACILHETEWENLKAMRQDVTSHAMNIFFDRIFKKLIEQEATRCAPRSPDLDKIDAEMVLTTSLIELTKTHLGKSISNVFECDGCDRNLCNQLGHDCVLLNYEQRMLRFGDKAIFDMNLEHLAADFIEKNKQIANYITGDFLKSLDVVSLLNVAKQMYVSSDPMPYREL